MHQLHPDQFLADIPPKLLVRLLLAMNRPYGRLYHRLVVHRPVSLPRRGPGIVASNHISGLDPLLIQSLVPRHIIWMMTADFYDVPRLNSFFRTAQTIRVDQSGGGLSAMRQALRALENGRLLGVFPEGRIERTNELLPFQPGAAMIALRTGVPVYPVCLEGTQRNRPMIEALIVPQRAHLACGPPVRFAVDAHATRQAVDFATGALRAAVDQLWHRIHQSRGRSW